MSDEPKPVSISILDKEYLVACKDSEREPLFAALEFLNSKMQEVRDSGKVIGSERMAVMAALNIAHEYLEYKRQKDDYTSDIGAGIRRMETKIAAVLTKSKQEVD
jgi:cell division protein ZapA